MTVKMTDLHEGMLVKDGRYVLQVMSLYDTDPEIVTAKIRGAQFRNKPSIRAYTKREVEGRWKPMEPVVESTPHVQYETFEPCPKDPHDIGDHDWQLVNDDNPNTYHCTQCGEVLDV